MSVPTEDHELSKEEKKIRKVEKKARKEAKRLAKESPSTTPAPTPVEVIEEVKEPKKSKDKKRKREEAAATEEEQGATVKDNDEAAEGEGEKKKRKKNKKNKGGAFGNLTTLSTSVPPSIPSTPPPTTSSKEIADFLETNRIAHEPEEAVTEFPPVFTFDALPLDAGLAKGLAAYSKPTPIQSAAFPVMMGGRDIVGVAETGSGKTVAFGVPLIQHILSLPIPTKKAPISALIVAPTRELALQTSSNLSAITSHIPSITSLCIYGGVSKDDQKKSLRSGPRIIVGTPGRILDLASEGALDLSKVSWVVLDEADRMLDKGFENDIREIIKLCLPIPASPLVPIGGPASALSPSSRITAMFSATWPQSVRRLASDFMRSPIRITVGSDSLTANSRVEQTVQVIMDGRQKESRLLEVLREHGFNKGGSSRSGGKGKEREKCLCFALYKKEAARVSDFLARQGYEVGCIQGDMTQDRRTKSLEDFKEGRTQILVATDVAARGLDIPKVELVVNQTFPLTIEDYVHRIGRTGRAGRTGKSVTFFTEADKAHAGELIRVLRDGNHPVPEGLDQWGTVIKKAVHSSYGAHFRDDIKGTAKKITFD